MSTLNVTVVGASGETGRAIVDGLLDSPTNFKITALVRPSSVNKPEVEKIKTQGVTIVPVDLVGSQEDLVKALSGQDVVISALEPFALEPQFALANAAKDAGVKRYVPSAFGPSCPPTGVMHLRDIKEEIINHIKKIYLPYTIIDVGLWYQGTLPTLPSGKIDYALTFPALQVAGDGHGASAITDLRDVGKYVARIITDERTLNKYVFAYNEVWTQEQIYSHLEKVSGEKVKRNRVSAEEIKVTIAAAQAKFNGGDKSYQALIGLAIPQYLDCEWFRGDNLPESAKYLGYLSTQDLYPDFEFIKYKDYVQEVVDGKGVPIYANRGA
ncbi:hypothetical protein NM208_g8046 [Fusarium decemcellulare]|uniref:Uncharacterized protein n=1 Tax=Fusarium decemcellulare TaxID=57161 RepID=A0ACC1S6R7_9HYPO|nr:hypothetical protein NM208_g8046 [Fusarium decemcellulare]